jgi:uncharacterized membrane protein YsdA (DUF1294 family)/cold shock CspA family protein
MSKPEKTDRPSPVKAELVEWNQQKCYGFLQMGKTRVFLHIRDFAELHKKPVTGDRISFVLGQDAQGRTCATQAVHVNDGGRISVISLLVMCGLLVMPVLALRHLKVDWRWAAGMGITINVLAYVAYAVDKRRAREKAWRISEARLHLVELLGGWPGAFMAQRRLRHKCSKVSFQSVFWLIVLAYQFFAFDSLLNWRYSRSAWEQLQRGAQHRHSAG